MTILYFIDIVGTMVFAISGALTASILVIMSIRILAMRYNWSLPARRATD